MNRTHFRARALTLIAVFSFGVTACKNTSNTPGQGSAAEQPAAAARPDSAATAATANMSQGQRAHETSSILNADGVVPAKDSTGVMVVGWDELVRNGEKYRGQRVHLKTYCGGTLDMKQKGSSMGILFPIDIDTTMSSALVEFVHNNPSDAHTLPVTCVFRAGSKKPEAGRRAVIEGTVEVLKSGPASGFAVKRGITTMSYVLLQNASVVKK